MAGRRIHQGRNDDREERHERTKRLRTVSPEPSCGTGDGLLSHPHCPASSDPSHQCRITTTTTMTRTGGIQRRLSDALCVLDKWTADQTGKLQDAEETGTATATTCGPHGTIQRRHGIMDASDAVEQIYELASISAGLQPTETAAFLESILSCGGIPRLLEYAGTLMRTMNRSYFNEDECDHWQCANDDDNDDNEVVTTITVQRVGQIVAHCLYYSQARDDERVRLASTAAARAVLSHGGLSVLLLCLSSVIRPISAISPRDIHPASRHREVQAMSALWTALSNLTLFGEVMATFCSDDEKRALIDAALQCLNGISMEDGNTTATWTSWDCPADARYPLAGQQLPVCTIFGVLTNLLARDGPSSFEEPTTIAGVVRPTPLEQMFIESGVVSQCMQFLRHRGSALYRPQDRRLLASVMDFFNQCTRKPAIEQGEIRTVDYQELLVPLCVNGIKSLTSTAATTSPLDEVDTDVDEDGIACLVASADEVDSLTDDNGTTHTGRGGRTTPMTSAGGDVPPPSPDLPEQVHLHACIILHRAALRLATKNDTAGGRVTSLVEAGVITALGMTLDHPTSNASFCWTKELALKVLKQIVIVQEEDE